MRLCATPGCVFPDKHDSPCSMMIDMHETRRAICSTTRYKPANPVSINKKTHRNVTLCSVCRTPGHNMRTCLKWSSSKANTLLSRKNNFQLEIDAVRILMESQVGVTFTSNTAALAGHWLDEHDSHYDATYVITGVANDSQKNVVVGFSPDDNTHFAFPSVVFMDKRTKVKWNKLPNDIYDKLDAELRRGTKHTNSMRRAKEFIDEYVATCACSSEDIIITLDGNGTNPKAMRDRLVALGIDEKKWPRIIVVEKNPNVALAQQIMYPGSVIFTGADATFRTKTLLGNGVLLEHMIAKTNSLLTDDMKSHVKAVYFDYCGGPPGYRQAEKCRMFFSASVFPKLPALAVCMMTSAYRNNPSLNETGIDGLVDFPKAFRKIKSFRDNKRVLCELFSRRALNLGSV